MTSILFLGGALDGHTIPANALPFLLKVDEPLPLPGNPRLIVVRGSEPMRERAYILRGNVATSTGIIAATALKDFEAGQMVGADEIVPPERAGESSEASLDEDIATKALRNMDRLTVQALIRSDPRVRKA
jgi:hypothetical protein